MNLTEALKTKKEKIVFESELQENFVEQTRPLELRQTLVMGTSELVQDYISQDIKKRAQTIGAAYNIAIKIAIELLIDVDIKLPYIENSFFSKYLSDDDMKAQVRALGEEYPAIFERAADIKSTFSDVYSDNKPFEFDDWFYTILKRVADVSVTLAWLKAKYNSGFFPADISVMLTDSETHAKMVEEVYALLKFIQQPELRIDGTKSHLYIEPEVFDEETGLYERLDFILNEGAYDLTTSSKLDDNKVDTTRIKSFKALNDKLGLYDITYFAVDYMRHLTTITYE